MLDDVRAASRAETRAAAQRLTGIWNLYKVRLRETGDHAEWAVDTWDAVAAEVAAALNITLMLAGSYVRLAKAMHERLPLLGMVFAAGDIDYRSFQTMVYRTDLITDPDTLAVRWRAREPHPALDRALAVQVGPRGSTALSPRLNGSRFAVAKERVEDRRWSSLIPVTGWPRCTPTCLPPTGTHLTSGWMHSQPPSATQIRVRSSSGERTQWRARPVRIAWLPMRKVRLPGRRQGAAARRPAPGG